jgi:hypothetical protein
VNPLTLLSRRGLRACVTVALLALGCSDDPAAARVEGTFVGTVEGTDMRVGLVTGPTDTAIFFCGGSASLPTTTWMRPATSAGDIDVDVGKAHVHAAVSATRITGAFEPGDGQVLTFSADRVPDDGSRGLYEQSDEQGRAAVVVFADDQLQGAFIRASDGFVMQVVPVKPGPLDSSAGSLAVRVDARLLTVFRVRPR